MVVAVFMLIFATAPAVRKWRRTTAATPIKIGTGLRSGQQRVAIEGRAEKLQALLTSPMQKADCLAYQYKVEERQRNRRRTNWATIQETAAAVPFRVDDTTGRIQVHPGDTPLLDLSQRRTRDITRGDSSNGPLRIGQTRHRHTESRLDPDDFCCVVGQATSTADGFMIKPVSQDDPVIIADIPYRRLRRKMLRMAILITLISLVLGGFGIALLLEHFGLVDTPFEP